jgi:hypothetical protein
MFEAGIKKGYQRDGWKNIRDLNIPVGAILRHLGAIQRGEFIDPETGECHVNAVLCNAAILQHVFCETTGAEVTAYREANA